MIVKRQQVTEMPDSKSPYIASSKVECLAKLNFTVKIGNSYYSYSGFK